MLRTRVIPCLLLHNESLVKTIRFKRFGYIGDPVNTCRIFNELLVDELVFLDIQAHHPGHEPNFKVLQEISNECFMPLAYGGGIRDIQTAERIFSIGFEKIVLNSAPFEQPSLIPDLVATFGSQSVIAAIDVRRKLWGKYEVYSHSGKRRQQRHPVDWAQELEHQGVGELLLTAIDREGAWQGMDINLTRMVADAVDLPVVAHGGAGSVEHIGQAVHDGHASAVALGSMVVYQGRGRGVLVNFPDRTALEKILKTCPIRSVSNDSQ